MAILLTLAVGVTPLSSQTETSSGARLKDVVTLYGANPTPVVGYGLVIGLNKTGDKRQTIFSAQTLASMLDRFGVSVSATEIKVENIAAVLVTAELPAYSRIGMRLDVTASSVGDARSLQGGILLPTALRGPDGRVLATAQGALSLGGFGGGSAGNNVQVNHLTVGRVPNGALVNGGVPTPMPITESSQFTLKEPDFISAGRIAQVINAELGPKSAAATDAGTVTVHVPAENKDAGPDLIARLEPLGVDVDATARVVINERTGTVVVGGAVRLGPAAVAHGNLSVRISTQLTVSQPQSLAPKGAETLVVPNEHVDVSEGRAQLLTLPPGTTLEEVVRGLNALGATPRDIIAIMQALKAAGALRAELVIL
jgi:flagellar P-ring protein precursor FlgI